MRNVTLANVIKFLGEQVFNIFAVPHHFHSDNGLFQKFLMSFSKRYETTHIKTAFYLPQTKAAERVYRTVLQIVKSFIKDKTKLGTNT